MKPEVGKEYYVGFGSSARLFKETCVALGETGHIFDDGHIQWLREEREIRGEVPSKPMEKSKAKIPWLLLVVLLGVISLSFLSGYAIGRINNQPTTQVEDK